MKKTVRLLPKIVTFLVLTLAAGPAWGQVNLRRPLMTPESWVEWMSNFPPVVIGPSIQPKTPPQVLPKASLSLLNQIPYVPADRDQGGCGNCWVWASTGCIEVEHSVLYGVSDRLSIQYFDSCYGGDACCGGNPGPVATFYSTVQQAVPWADPGAAFVDGARGCGDPIIQPCGNITTTPAYPITSITANTIDTHNVGQAAAIAAIKNVLNQHKAIYFGFALPNGAAWGDFQNFYFGAGGETEATLWGNIDNYCNTQWDTNSAGGHAVVLLGYNDDDPNPTNHYWLMLNSWGTAGGVRPNDLFRIPMDMNYDCYYPFPAANKNLWAFAFEYFDVGFGNSPPVSRPGGPYVAECAGADTTVHLDGSASSDLEGPVTYAWTSDCPGAKFDDATSATPVLTLDSSSGCLLNCQVTLIVTDSGGLMDTNSADVTVHDTTPPTLVCPAPMVLEFTDANGAVANFVFTASDACSSVSVVSSPPSGSVFPIGTTPVSATATDGCGNTNSCSFTVTVLGPLGVKQNVLTEMVALRATVTDRQDANKLDSAITFLNASLDSAFWVDQTHVVPVAGGMVFQREKQTVEKLEQLIRDSRSTVAKATLQDFINRIVRSDRLLAVVAINEAIAASGNFQQLALAQGALARGDADAAGAAFSNAVEDYRIAWMKALQSF